MNEAVIVSGARTAIAKAKGSLAFLTPDIYGAEMVKEAVKRSGLNDLEAIEEVIFGNCLSPQFGCMARHVTLKAGLPMSIPALTLDRRCGSGSTAVNLAAVNIWAGVGDIYVAGGVDSMTRIPYYMERPNEAFSVTPPRFYGPNNAPEEIGNPPMGITGEKVASRYGISREEQDELSYLSQIKAEKAIREGRFKEQIVPMVLQQKKGEPIIFDTDEHPRFGTTQEALAKLLPAFKKDGTVTAGNSSGINDASAAMVLMSKRKADELGIRPLVKVLSVGYGGVDPNIMGMGPVPAVHKALARAGLDVNQLDVIELNEAFASQVIACCNELGIDWRDKETFNPNGGAIALGHPIAASLAILVLKAIYELKRTGKIYALISACCGGGQGVATILENV